jgi:transcriptional regulator with XRE-family HTH domain
MEERIGDRIRRERILRGWKRPRVIQELEKHGVELTAEAIRRYEMHKDNPGKDVRRGLSMVFGKDEAYLEFGYSIKPPKGEGLSGKELQIAAEFRECSPDIQDIIEALLIVGRRKIVRSVRR